jgi:glutaredoxin 3
MFIVYTNSGILCPYCDRAKRTLAEHGYKFEERDVLDPAVRAELKVRRPTARTVPQIFLENDYYIGGCDDLLLHVKNDTLDLLIEANTEDIT